MSELAFYRARDFELLADCPDCSPSPDTFERLMSAVDPDEIERCLIEHGRKYLDTLAEKQVLLGGKNYAPPTKNRPQVWFSAKND